MILSELRLRPGEINDNEAAFLSMIDWRLYTSTRSLRAGIREWPTTQGNPSLHYLILCLEALLTARLFLNNVVNHKLNAISSHAPVTLPLRRQPLQRAF